MALFIFLPVEEAPQGGFELSLGIVFSRRVQEKTGIVDEAAEPPEGFLEVQEGVPVGILRQFQLPRRGEQRREVGRFSGLKRKARE
jgi:hypothetical protein